MSPNIGFCTFDVVLVECQARRCSGQKMAFTNGVFDLIHPGHVATLRYARGLADFLVVGLNSDESVRRLKGPKRPLLLAQERGKILASLDMVDYVVEFGENDPERLIRVLQPDVLVKGGDYDLSHIVGRDIVEAHGGRVATVPFLDGRSTSDIVQRVLDRAQ
jgi:rfaE bifunctional protein nucleotidyltransferase chain/domain